MYSIIIAAVLGIAVGVAWALSGLWGGWILGMILASIVLIATFFVISRIVNKRLEPRMLQVQRQIQSGSPQLGLKSLEEMLSLGKWQLMLEGQLQAQIGSIHYGLGDEKKAIESLSKSSPRATDGQMILASISFRKGDYQKAVGILETAIRFNKKNAMLYNLLAYMQLARGDRDAAISTLNRGKKANPIDNPTKENLNRLRNGKRMVMRSFGMPWYSLKLEKVPGSMRRMPGGHPGFRQRRMR